MIDMDKIKPQIKELAEKYGLKLVMLFGSQASGKTHKESDVDFAFTADEYISSLKQRKLFLILPDA